MDAPGGDGWVCEGDLAPSFELPDAKFKPVSPIGANAKVKLQCSLLYLYSFVSTIRSIQFVDHVVCVRIVRRLRRPDPTDRFRHT